MSSNMRVAAEGVRAISGRMGTIAATAADINVATADLREAAQRLV
jgi:hypothetical protein